MSDLNYIVVEGPIGVGKTTLARRLAESFAAELLLEEPEQNPFLARFYENPRAHALSTQLYFLLQRVRQTQGLRQSDLFSSPVDKESRSLMNVPFVTGDKDLDAKFIEEAGKRGLKTLKGHRTVGGMRASIYNAMPLDGVKVLVQFMEEFEKDNTK